MRVVIATTQLPLVQGGAEYQAEGLVAALVAAGHEAEVIKIPENGRAPDRVTGDWAPPEQLEAAIRFCLNLDLSSCAGKKIDRLIGFKFPAYLISHPQKVQWILHQQRWLYDLWSRFASQIPVDSAWLKFRDTVHRIDAEYIPRARAVFATSRNVANRLKRYNGIDAFPLYHPPPLAGQYYCAPADEHLFLPSRICYLKRHELVLDALARTKRPVTVMFAGTADDPKYGRLLMRRAEELKVNKQCVWLGWVSEEEKIRLYSRCLGVVYPPYDEDLGYVTLEAMLASKPVITCTDSGGPLEFVRHEESGLICNPTPKDLAAAMDMLWKERTLAESMGRAGRKRYLDLNLSWSSVVEKLLC
ncbi:MAG TPA: glycosyltransferase family 4 protein [Desulfomonilaceae bacterium]|nr:glycosyltransferase family 4 protein [Desulfomonilaceae bacterium]